ncbi:MAG: hypothetical protein ACLFSE_13305 [Spirochaetia bacterium]
MKTKILNINEAVEKSLETGQTVCIPWNPKNKNVFEAVGGVNKAGVWEGVNDEGNRWSIAEKENMITRMKIRKELNRWSIAGVIIGAVGGFLFGVRNAAGLNAPLSEAVQNGLLWLVIFAAGFFSGLQLTKFILLMIIKDE